VLFVCAVLVCTVLVCTVLVCAVLVCAVLFACTGRHRRHYGTAQHADPSSGALRWLGAARR